MASGLWLWKLTKLGVVGGAVYVTVSNGIWSQENSQVRSLIDKYRGPLVHVNEAQQELEKPWGETWNKGVQRVFAAIASSPDIAVDYTKKALKTTKDLVDGKKS